MENVAIEPVSGGVAAANALALKDLTAAMLKDATDVDAGDLLLPKVLLMQGQSKAVTKQRANIGDIVDSLEYKLLFTDKEKKSVDIVPFHIGKSWVIFEKKKDKNGQINVEFLRVVPFGADNADWKWDGEEKNAEGQVIQVRRDVSMDVYCLLADAIKTGIILPHVLSFRRTSYVAGKKLRTFEMMLKGAKRPLASKVFTVRSDTREKDGRNFFAYDLAMGRDATQDEMLATGPWYLLVKNSQVRVDDSDLREEAPDAQEAQSGMVF